MYIPIQSKNPFSANPCSADFTFSEVLKNQKYFTFFTVFTFYLDEFFTT